MGRSAASASSKQHPSYRLLEQNGFQQEAYEQYRRRCLKERKHVGEHALCISRHYLLSCLCMSCQCLAPMPLYVLPVPVAAVIVCRVSYPLLEQNSFQQEAYEQYRHC